MQKNILVRSIAALSGIVMLASVAACGDNTATTTDNSSSSDSTSKSTPISGNFSGAGASSQQAAVEAWIAGFQGTNPEAKIAYNPSGSGAGVQTFLTGATAWAGSDKALADDEVEQSKSVCTEGTAFDVPVYISPIAVVFNDHATGRPAGVEGYLAGLNVIFTRDHGAASDNRVVNGDQLRAVREGGFDLDIRDHFRDAFHHLLAGQDVTTFLH